MNELTSSLHRFSLVNLYNAILDNVLKLRRILFIFYI